MASTWELGSFPPFVWEPEPERRHWRVLDMIEIDVSPEWTVEFWPGHHDTIRHETWILPMPYPCLW